MQSKELRAALKRLKMSQGMLAAYAGVTRGAVSHWARGVRPIPGPVVKLIELLLEENAK
jgi:DNA-binding transcriptional regulator YiaG